MLESAAVECIRKNDLAGRMWHLFPFVAASAAEVRGVLPTEMHGTRVFVHRHYTGLEMAPAQIFI
jgi:hypothetical protein